MGVGEKSPRKSSITNITAAAVAPIIGMSSNSTTTNTASTIGKRTTEGSSHKHPILQALMLNRDKFQQQQTPVSPTSPTVARKGASVTITTPSYSNAIEGEPGNTNNPIVNNNYITPPNPNTRAHGLTATQLTGVKNWWKSQMECVSSDEEW